ncbi:MAG TPA: arginase [Lutibacter sp.]|nr:arginase [Lutibacter sp.]
MNNIFDFIQPIKESFVDFIGKLPNSSLGKNLIVNYSNNSFELIPNSVVLIGVSEERTAVNNVGCGKDIEAIRKAFYQLYLGNWKTSIYDLGNINIGASFKDTEAALKEVVTYLLQQKVLPIVIGGSQALTYASYRAFDSLEQKVNLTIVDAKFDLGSTESSIDSQSYLTKIIMDKPTNLFNFTNIGYQTFLNSQEEIGLLKTLLFDAYRLGDVKNNLELVEPTLRDSDMLSIDIGAIRKIDAPANNNNQISGFSADEICKITRYAGLSDKLKVLGIFEYNSNKDNQSITAELIAQMIWYFVEGVNLRSYEFPTYSLEDFKKYMVMIDDDTYQFYKSDISGRWWMEINVKDNNKTKRQTLIPCTYNDYLTANRQEVPERWLVNRRKLD